MANNNFTNIMGFGCCSATPPAVSVIRIFLQCTACGGTKTTHIEGYLHVSGKANVYIPPGGGSLSLLPGTYSYVLTTGFGTQTGSLTKVGANDELDFTVTATGNPVCGCHAPASVSLTVTKPFPDCGYRQLSDGSLIYDQYVGSWVNATFTCQPAPLSIYNNGQFNGYYPTGSYGMFSGNVNPGPYRIPIYYELTCELFGGIGIGADGVGTGYIVKQRYYTGGDGNTSIPPSLGFPPSISKGYGESPFFYKGISSTLRSDGSPCQITFTLS
jgi:hypothetical protein